MMANQRRSSRRLSTCYKKLGVLEKGESYGTWTLLHNRQVLRSCSGFAEERCKVYFFERRHFFKALAMGLESPNPSILKIMKVLPVFNDVHRFLILSNISKLRIIKVKYGSVLVKEGAPAKYVYILKSGSLNVSSLSPLQTFTPNFRHPFLNPFEGCFFSVSTHCPSLILADFL